MKKTCITLCLFLYVISAVVAQEKRSSSRVSGQTSFYAELGGPGILFSANIDQRFNKSSLGFGGRVGIGFVSGNFNDNNSYFPQSVVTFPVQLNYLFGKDNSVHAFEVGLGATFVGRKVDILDFNDDHRTQVFGTACFMYRRQPKNGGFSWRGGLTPLIAKGYIEPFAGFSVGYTF